MEVSPAEKAQQLYNKFYGIPLYILTVKQCCHIAVDQVLEFMKMDDDLHEDAHFANSRWVQYWVEVKQEINKL